jgi:uncharacterized protein (TIGR02444 family)
MGALELDNPFWQFSLEVYRVPGVQQECLEGQDKLGLDVNVLLLAAWLGAKRGVVLPAADFLRIRVAAVGWSEEVVQPLRSVRRTLKEWPEFADGDVQKLRKRVAEAELFAEQIEQALLYGLSAEFAQSAEGSEAAARSNITALLVAMGAATSAHHLLFARLLAASTT